MPVELTMSRYARPPSARPWLIGIGLLSLAAVAIALISQYRFDMQPCPWCILQRLIFLVIAVLALGAAATRSRGTRSLLAGLAGLLAVGGLAAALYQHFVAAKSMSCNLTFADRVVGGLSLDRLLPSVFQVMANCGEAAVSVLGVPYEFWSAALFALLAACAFTAIRRLSGTS